MGEKVKEGEKMRDRITFEEGKIHQVYHDGWLLIRMEDGVLRHYEPRDVERIGPVSS